MNIQQTQDLTSQAYQDALNIRKAVFVDEQHVPEDLEIDENETKALYFIAYSDDGQALGTARLLPQPHLKFDLIQRVAVAKSARQQHVGAALLKAIAAYHQSHYPDRFLQLGAQEHAIGFYEKNGFEVIADELPYMDAGIRHREMRYVAPKN